MHAKLNTLVDLTLKSAASVEPAQALMGAIIPVVAIPIAHAVPA